MGNICPVRAQNVENQIKQSIAEAEKTIVTLQNKLREAQGLYQTNHDLLQNAPNNQYIQIQTTSLKSKITGIQQRLHTIQQHKLDLENVLAQQSILNIDTDIKDMIEKTTNIIPSMKNNIANQLRDGSQKSKQHYTDQETAFNDITSAYVDINTDTYATNIEKNALLQATEKQISSIQALIQPVPEPIDLRSQFENYRKHTSVSIPVQPKEVEPVKTTGRLSELANSL